MAAWLARDDLTATIPDFIALAEAEFNRTLRIKQQETKVSYSITGEYVAVPSDFAAVKAFSVTSSGTAYSLAQMPHELQSVANNSSGAPQYFTVTGSNFRFAPVPDATYTASLIYFATIPPLASNSTNWLLTAFPDAYLFGAVLRALIYIQDDERIARIGPLYAAAMSDVQKYGNADRWSGPTLATRAA